MVNDSGIIESICNHSEKFFGYSDKELIGFPLSKLVPANVYDPYAPRFRDRLAAGEYIETTFYHKSGYFFIGRMQQVKTGDGKNMAGKPDFSIQKLAGDKVVSSVLADCQQFGHLGAWQYDNKRNRFAWSDGMFRLFEIEPGATLNPEHALYYFHEDQHKVKGALRRCAINGKAWEIEVQIITARNRVKQVRVAGKGHSQNGKVIRITGICQEISGFYQLKKEKEFIVHCINGILQSTNDLVLTLDSNLKVIMLNEGLNQQFEATFGERLSVGQNLMSSLRRHPNEKRIYQRLWQRALSRDSFCVEMPLAQREEDMPVYEMYFHRIVDNKGALLGACCIAKNVTSHINVQEKLNYMARHDPLTGLYNRREFLTLLSRSIANAKKRGTNHALLYMDLEEFYQVNETEGQSAGDSLLREVGQILTTKLRQRDIVARIGGDEFTALLENCGDVEAERVAEGIRDAIRDLEFVYRDTKHKIGISIGIVVINHLCDSPNKLMKLADSVCYAAKTTGKNRVHVFRPKVANVKMEEKALATIDLIKRALEFSDYFKLYTQAIKPITSAVWGDYFEVLYRIHDEKGNLVLPEDFMPIAQEYDMTREIDLLVVKNTLNWLATKADMMHRLKQVFITISDLSARHSGFVEKLADIVQKSGFEPSRLCFEVSEHFFLTSPGSADIFVNAMKTLGCSLAIDNAGSDASNYEYITRFDTDFIKINGEAINQMGVDPVKLVMVDAIHRISSLSGKQTIASHIADERSLAEARKLGLHFGQGVKLGEVIPVGYTRNTDALKTDALKKEHHQP